MRSVSISANWLTAIACGSFALIAGCKNASSDGGYVEPGESVARVRQAANRMKDLNNLKQLSLSMHALHDTIAHMPSAIFDKEGKPLLSWRVAILPYIDQDALYNKFKLDEPWDGPNNKALISQMPETFATPGISKPKGFETHFRIFVSEPVTMAGVVRAPFCTVGPPRGWGCTLASIVDGTSFTLMIVESEDSVPWTKPDELLYDVKKPLPKMATFWDGGFQAARMDGSVFLVPPTVKESTLRKLIQCNDGESIDPNELK